MFDCFWQQVAIRDNLAKFVNILAAWLLVLIVKILMDVSFSDQFITSRAGDHESPPPHQHGGPQDVPMRMTMKNGTKRM